MLRKGLKENKGIDYIFSENKKFVQSSREQLKNNLTFKHLFWKEIILYWLYEGIIWRLCYIALKSEKYFSIYFIEEMMKILQNSPPLVYKMQYFAY